MRYNGQVTEDTGPAHRVFVVPMLKLIAQLVILPNWLAITILALDLCLARAR